MGTNSISLSKLIDSAKSLSTNDKVKLIRQVSGQVERELRTGSSKHGKSLRGLWRGLDIAEDDITEARTEMWQNFPGRDF